MPQGTDGLATPNDGKQLEQPRSLDFNPRSREERVRKWMARNNVTEKDMELVQSGKHSVPTNGEVMDVAVSNCIPRCGV